MNRLIVGFVALLLGLLVSASDATITTESLSAPPEARAAPDRPGWAHDARTGCAIWDPSPQPGATVSWSGGCDADGHARGHGTLEWRFGGKASRFEGGLRGGRRHGRGVQIFWDGTRYEGEFRDDRYEGHGVLTYPDGRRFEGTFRDGVMRASSYWVSWEVSRDFGWLTGKSLTIRGLSVAMVVVSGVATIDVAVGLFLGIRWIVFRPGDRGQLPPRDRRMIAASGVLGSGFSVMLLAAALHFLSLNAAKASAEILTIAVVALALVVFLEPLFERIRESLGLAVDHDRPAKSPQRWSLRTLGFVLFVVSGVAHTLLHEFIKAEPETVSVLLAGAGAIVMAVTTYCWMLGWHPDPARSRAARRGAVSGAVIAPLFVAVWLPHLTGATQLVVLFLGMLTMISVPFAGGLAMDRGWGWGRGWQSRPSLSMTASMLAAWIVTGGLFWVWVLTFEPALARALTHADLPIPGPTMANLADTHVTGRVFVLLSGPIGVVGWGLGLFASRRFDRRLTERRSEHRERLDRHDADGNRGVPADGGARSSPVTKVVPER